mmetsp:Transcript_63328/g.178757  ORF Transcript_63328/g.178757 Transcript_63328/m.178757 type:complete len:818 (-) Transcript_63328:133-2586(-)
MTMELPADISLNKYSLEFSFLELQGATNNFDVANQLGEGAFGAVYKGIRPSDGTEIAVKALDVPEEGGFEEEVRVLSKFRHPNLVILLGFARRGKQRLLVYELLEGGDVYHRLQNSTRGTLSFPWRARVSAAYDACCGLSHLHNSKPKAFHRDIKSANILLDRNGTAKMADFGLACLSHTQEHQVQQAGGTPGYACPHYVRTRIVTEGSEVYSFGIVLLELLTARAPAWMARTPQGGREYSFLVSIINNDVQCAVSLADAKTYWPKDILHRLAVLALRCSSYVEEPRPRFAEVVGALRALRDLQEVEVQSPPLSTQAPAPCFGAVCAPAPTFGAGAPVGAPAPMYAPTPALPAHVQPAEILQIFAPTPAPAAAPVQLLHFHQIYIPSPAPAAAAVQQAEFYMPSSAPAPAPVQQVELDHAPPQHSMELMWSLECIYVEGLAVTGIPSDLRSIGHWQEVGAPALCPFKIGRRFQEDLFVSLLPREDVRNMISREHFSLWAVDAFAASPCVHGSQPCNFFITNLSSNYTSVNGFLLDVPDKHVQLHEGDLIGIGQLVSSCDLVHYTPFIQFRFHLEGAKLIDASALPLQQAPGMASARQEVAEESLSEQSEEVLLWEPALSEQASGCGACVSQSGYGVRPRFALELRGSSLLEDVAASQRRIVHGPPVNDDGGAAGAGGPFAPLVLGRGHATVFWQQLLSEEAFQSLSRDHVVFEPLPEGPSSARWKEQQMRGSGVMVRNLSALRPVRVCEGSDEESLRDAKPLAQGECRELRHGDVVVLNAAKACSLWVVFRDLQVAGGSQRLGLNGEFIGSAVVGGA